MNATPASAPATAPAWAAPGSTVLVAWEDYRPRSASDLTLNCRLHLAKVKVLRHTATMLVLDDGTRYNHDLTPVGRDVKTRLVDPVSDEARDLLARARVQFLRANATKAAKVFAAEPSTANADLLTQALTEAREAGVFGS